MQASLYEASIQTPGVFKLGREEPHEYESTVRGKWWLVFCLVIINVL